MTKNQRGYDVSAELCRVPDGAVILKQFKQLLQHGFWIRGFRTVMPSGLSLFQAFEERSIDSQLSLLVHLDGKVIGFDTIRLNR